MIVLDRTAFKLADFISARKWESRRLRKGILYGITIHRASGDVDLAYNDEQARDAVWLDLGRQLKS